MARLEESLSRFFGRVEILARGAEEDRRAAERALARGDMLEARAHARALLARVPRSPLGLALWADAAEGCWLDGEVVEALSQLSEQVPWRSEVWLRLGLAGSRSGWPGAREALERAAHGDDAAVIREALLALADLDLAGGELARARRWLERVPSHPSQPDPELALRRAECALALGDVETARRAVEVIDGRTRPIDATTLLGRERLVRARLAQRFPRDHHGDHAVSLALGAMVLDAPGADALAAELLAGCDDTALVARARAIVGELGRLEEPRWRAAFALAEGRRADARAALLAAVAAGDADAARTLEALAVRWRDLEAGRIALAATSTPKELAEGTRPQNGATTGLGLVIAAARLRDEGRASEALDTLERADHGEAADWARALVTEIVGGWLAGEEADWDSVLGELRAAAKALERGELSAPIETLAVERGRPLYVAVVGEFNAGKSTLINALVGTDVAPTGVVPTTASLHWVSWAPDPFARIVVRSAADRLVPHGELKRALGELRAEGKQVDRVLIYAPLERLRHIEILDTPGFNAPDQTHADAARHGIEEAHVALWLLDATAPLKDTERRVLEQVAEAAVPVQVIVNKRDRLAPDEIDRVMAYVAGALRDTGIATLRPPIAISAQLALRGRLGDQQALADSHWQELEALLGEHVVDRCDELRERALRRKAAAIADELARAATTRARADAEARGAARRLADGVREAAADLRANRAAAAREIAAALGPALARLAADARPLAQLGPERRDDPEVRAYLVERTVARLGPVVGDALSARAGVELDATVTAAVRSALAGAAAVHHVELTGRALEGALEAAVGAAADALESRATTAPGPTPATLEVRLACLAAALRQRAAGPASGLARHVEAAVDR
jgi:GTP-binding protein EngB required for normal cell division